MLKKVTKKVKKHAEQLGGSAMGPGGATGTVGNLQAVASTVLNKVLPSNSKPPAPGLAYSQPQSQYQQEPQYSDPNIHAHAPPPQQHAPHAPHAYPTYPYATQVPYNYAAASNLNPHLPPLSPYQQYNAPTAPSPYGTVPPQNYYHLGSSYPPPYQAHLQMPVHAASSPNPYMMPTSSSPSLTPNGYPSSTVPARPTSNHPDPNAPTHPPTSQYAPPPPKPVSTDPPAPQYVPPPPTPVSGGPPAPQYVPPPPKPVSEGPPAPQYVPPPPDPVSAKPPAPEYVPPPPLASHPQYDPKKHPMGEYLQLPPGVLEGAVERANHARTVFGEGALMEAGKGLSRVLHLYDPADIDLFGEQLKNMDSAVIANEYATAADGVAVFALSYVQSKTAIGRFKFTDEQWFDLKKALIDLGSCGVQKLCLWYDQCLWLRDASQRSWAHIGILPYAIWPVLSLGTKQRSSDQRTMATYKRFWPFVEELASLWGGGLIITRELRSPTSNKADTRSWYSYNSRATLSPEEALRIMLLNIFHGAAENLRTGWAEDVVELKEMARLNVMYGSMTPVIGADWRQRLGSSVPHAAPNLLGNLLMLAAPEERDTDEEYEEPRYLDGTRLMNHTGFWDGISEFLSGNGTVRGFTEQERGSFSVDLYIIVADSGVYGLLCTSSSRQSTFDAAFELWVLTQLRQEFWASQLPSQFCPPVLWSKVMQGASVCRIRHALKFGNTALVSSILVEQMQCTAVQIQSINPFNYTLNWCEKVRNEFRLQRMSALLQQLANR